MDTQKKIRVLVVDDHPSVRAGAKSAMELEPDFEVSTAGNSVEARRLMLMDEPIERLEELRRPRNDHPLALPCRRLHAEHAVSFIDNNSIECWQYLPIAAECFFTHHM